MKLRLRLRLPASLPAIIGGMTQARAEDQCALASLMLDAYRGTADYNGETLAEAESEIAELMAGTYGKFLREHSFVRWEEQVLISATLVTLHEGTALMAFAMRWSRLIGQLAVKGCI